MLSLRAALAVPPAAHGRDSGKLLGGRLSRRLQPSPEIIDRASPWMIVRTDQVEAVSGKREVQRPHERASLELPRNQYVAANGDALAGDDRIDRVQLFPEVQMFHFAGVGYIAPFLSRIGQPSLPRRRMGY